MAVIEKGDMGEKGEMGAPGHPCDEGMVNRTIEELARISFGPTGEVVSITN